MQNATSFSPTILIFHQPFPKHYPDCLSIISILLVHTGPHLNATSKLEDENLHLSCLHHSFRIPIVQRKWICIWVMEASQQHWKCMCNYNPECKSSSQAKEALPSSQLLFWRVDLDKSVKEVIFLSIIKATVT